MAADVYGAWVPSLRATTRPGRHCAGLIDGDANMTPPSRARGAGVMVEVQSRSPVYEGWRALMSRRSGSPKFGRFISTRRGVFAYPRRDFSRD
jgi:hypothetical protein